MKEKYLMLSNLILALALCGACCHPQKHDNCPTVVVQKVECHCGGECKCVECKCQNCKCKGHTIKINNVCLHVIPTDDGVIVDFDSNKTLPADISYTKNKTGGYNVSVYVRDRVVK
jgi:hypothetical protein